MPVTTEPPRPLASEDVRLALRAATLYHLEGATQAEIAAKLGVSRPTAGRLIARARAQGLIRIEISIPDELGATVHTELERNLEQNFGLTEAVVTSAVPDGSPAGYYALGRAAVGVLARRLHERDTLGFTWGPETVAVAQALKPRSARCATVVQLDGSMTTTNYQTGVDFTLGTCAQLLQAEPVRLHAPLYADAATVTALQNDSLMGRALEVGRNADVMIFGIGPVSTATTLFEGSYLDTALLDELRRLGAVGEMGGRFYTREGADIDSSLTARTVSVPLDAVRACPAAVLVSGGGNKHEAILGALNAGLADIVVTDIDTARWLVEHKEAAPR
ncbi:MarR family transcriptional regulator [Nocardia speluncae]|uniref:MarR family transcriptional regulator n=1 Tax=Nocardia speluncae TaxID=419477 RepID=A0A846XBE5_9NOCA|nr:MarR family transcriptional regulator [Nocardia speluncae]